MQVAQARLPGVPAGVEVAPSPYGHAVARSANADGLQARPYAALSVRRGSVHGVTNRLFYGDNLDVLRQSVQSASVDLVYLDPPFNSNRNYNVIFSRKASHADTAQIPY